MRINLDNIYPTHDGLILKLNETCPKEQQTKDLQLNKDYSKLIYVNNEIPVGYINCDLITNRKSDNGIYVYSIVLLSNYQAVTDLNIFNHILDYIIDLAKTNHQRYITLYLPWDYDTNPVKSSFNEVVRWFIDHGDFKPLFENSLEPNELDDCSGAQKIILRRQL
ncbi:hypothetical protein RI543_002531 [Arxiozyma heterogenica]|uniref:Uncharacterized protein n=1 Tax=Arxiozyma heterogenica TaxID=278026 RepID=A0AAN7W2V5_9SACH|nr:hypothetical protein RI543_002531 [Kazachstania heterogenica]